MKPSKEELSKIIAAFLNKHGANRRMIHIDGYEFQVKGFTNVVIPSESINDLPNESIQFIGSAMIKQYDTASTVSTVEDVIFHGVAFFAKDVEGDDCLLKVSIDQIKLCKNHNSL